MAIRTFDVSNVGEAVGILITCLSQNFAAPCYPDTVALTSIGIGGNPLTLTVGDVGENQWVINTQTPPASITNWATNLEQNPMRYTCWYYSYPTGNNWLLAPAAFAEMVVTLFNAADANAVAPGWQYEIKEYAEHVTANGWTEFTKSIMFYYFIDDGNPPEYSSGLAGQTLYPVTPVVLVPWLQWLDTASGRPIYYESGANWATNVMVVTIADVYERLKMLNDAIDEWTKRNFKIWRGRTKRVQVKVPDWVQVPASNGTVETEVDRLCRLLMRKGLTTTTIYDESGSVDIDNATIRSDERKG